MPVPLPACGAQYASAAARHVVPSSPSRLRLALTPPRWLPLTLLPPAAARSGSVRCQAAKQPDSGYFADVDPNAEVLPVKSGLAGDVTQRSKSRWESDFIWNKDWAKQLDYEESLRRQQQEGEAQRAAGGNNASGAKGFLKLTSKVDLNSMDVDLSEQLRVRKNSGSSASSSSGAAPGGRGATQQQWQQSKRQPPKYGSVPPTRVEQRTWERSGKYSRKVVATAPTNEVDKDALAAKLEAERRRYDELKAELQAWAAGLTVVCLTATFAFYGRDVAASYGVGALGGLVYLRLLNRSVDSVGGGLGGALGQPRLLIPIILALGYNRYNTMVSEQTGLTLQLLPMLLGFFTYKGAVVAKQSLVLFGELTGNSTEAQQAEGGSEGAAAVGAGGAGDAAMDVASVDRAFRKKMLNEI